MQLHFAFDILLCVFIAGFTFTHIMQRAEIRALREQLSRRPSQPAPGYFAVELAEVLEILEYLKMSVSAQAQSLIDRLTGVGVAAQAAIEAAKTDSSAVQAQAAADAAQTAEDVAALNGKVTDLENQFAPPPQPAPEPAAEPDAAPVDPSLDQAA